MNKEKREYDNSKRHREAEQTKLEIVQALGRLWMKYSLTDITLDMVAEEAGVTTRTVLRKFGSRDGLLNETLNYDTGNISSDRHNAKVGDVEDILNTLLDNYETMGDAAIRTIHLEPELEIARKIGEQGRKVHRDWCKKMFAPYLPNETSSEYEIKLTAFIASTEIYLWKLMRKDLGLSKKETFQVFKRMLEGLIHNNTHNKKS